MVNTSYTNSPGEHAGIIFSLLDDLLYNHIIIGDIHAPMSQLSDIYKIVKDEKIIGGWSIFKGFEIPTIVFPPTIPESWEAIRSMINFLKIKEFYAPFPKYIDGEEILPPWHDWAEYQSEIMFTDIAMQLANKEIEVMDINDLPTIRGSKNEDAKLLEKYFKMVAEEEGYEGFFNPLQLETDLFVIAEVNGEVVGVGGAHFETPKTVQIGNIHVKKTHRRMGLGRAITTACVLGVLRTNRLPTLFVNENNDIACNLYESIGFKEYNKFAFHKLLRI